MLLTAKNIFFALLLSAVLLSAAPKRADLFSQLPLTFEENRGQFDDRVLFATRARGGNAFITRRGLVLDSGAGIDRSALMIDLVGADANSKIEGQRATGGVVSTFIGSDAANWVKGAALYRAVLVHSVSPGIDLLYHGSGTDVEFDLILRREATPNQLKLSFRGASAITIDSGGDLDIQYGSSRLIQHKPKVWQDINGRRIEVDAHYSLASSTTVVIQVGTYDRDRDLIVDPVVSFATYLSGSARIDSAATDPAGNVYVVGLTNSTAFPTTAGAYKTTNSTASSVALVSKINSSGTSLIYSTLIGSIAGTTNSSIAVDSSGNAYITGVPVQGYPSTAGALATQKYQSNIFVTKLNSTGSSLIYSTFLGSLASDASTAISVDSAGNAYIAGYTGGAFPITAGAYQTSVNAGRNINYQDGFVTKLNTAGNGIVYSTYLGGSDRDQVFALAIDDLGQAYVVGQTYSTDFPVTAGVFQSTHPSAATSGFVTCLNTSGSGLVYSTFLGGATTPTSLFVDAGRNAYLAGTTNAHDFPITPGVVGSNYSSSFITELNSTGTALQFSTYIGGFGATVESLAVDSSGSIVAVGETFTLSDFATTPGSFPSVFATDYSSSIMFLVKLSAGATSLQYSTTFGSVGYSYARKIILDSSGSAIIGGSNGAGSFPVTQGSIQPTSAGGGFIEKIDLTSPTSCALSLSLSTLTAPLTGTSGTVAVNTQAGCPWVAVVLGSYNLSVSSASGVGPGSFNYTVSSNATSFEPQAGQFRVGNSIVFVSQPAGSCAQPGLFPSSTSFNSSGGSGTLSVQLPSSCIFTPTATVPWIQLSSSMQSSGSTTLMFSVLRNDFAARSGSINIMGSQVAISQAGAGCTANLNSTAGVYPSQGGTGVVSLTTSGTSCQWTASSQYPWIRASTSSGIGSGTVAYVVSPNPGATLRSGNLLIAGQIFSISQAGGSTILPTSYNINTIAGSGAVNYVGTSGFSGDGGPAINAQFSYPNGLVYDSSGNLYISDSSNYRIRKIDTSGFISTILGNGSGTESPDGVAAISAYIPLTNLISVDSASTLLVGTAIGLRVRTVSPSGILGTLAGNGVFSSIAPTDGTHAVAAMPQLSGIVGDSPAAAYLSYGAINRIYRVANGTFMMYGGTGTSGFNGDGLNPLATQFSSPGGLAKDSTGNLYISELSRIRKISGGKVSTVAGGGSGDGENVSATSVSYTGSGLTIDGQGTLFYRDYQRIRRITAAGVLSTVAGNNSGGVSAGDGGPGLSASFLSVSGIAADSFGNIAVVDSEANRIRLLTPVYSACSYSLSTNSLQVPANAGSASVMVTTASTCAWNGTSNASWIVVTPSASGSGTAFFNFSANGGSPRTGTVYVAGQLVTVTQSSSSVTYGPAKVGVMQPARPAWALDSNGNGVFDVGDRFFSFLADPTDVAVVGDWNGDGHMKVGVYRSGFFCLDLNNNGVWDGPSGGDLFIALGGQPGDIPVVGDWNGNGKTKVGVYRHGFFILDTNGNGVFDSGDQLVGIGGYPGEQPVVGDWNGSGTTKVGVLDGTGRWILDYNGNGVFDAGDKVYSFPYGTGYKPVVGDWNGDKKSKIGVFTNGFWILDYNGNGVWEDVAGGDRFYGIGGNPGEIPVVGDWNGSGTTKVGVFVRGFWVLDYNGNGSFDSGDRFIALGGTTGEQPVVGPW